MIELFPGAGREKQAQLRRDVPVLVAGGCALCNAAR